MDTILELKNLHKRFGSNIVHSGVSFKIHQGERIALLGSSGTGKSVLLRSIIGLEFIDKGEIYYQGRRIDTLKEEEIAKLRTQISYSFQSGALFDSMTVFDNLAFPLFEHTKLTINEITKEVDQMLERIGLAGTNLKMPADLSGGMQKRIGMARSMILKPEIILYDEPTAGLDPENTVKVINLMKDFAHASVTSIFVSHDIPAVQKFCQRVIILEQGTVVYDDSIENFNKSDSPIVKIFLIAERFENAN